VGAICALWREAAHQGVQVTVASGEGFVRRVFELVHLADVMPVGTTPEEAMRVAASAL
jgi:hypothetical protein